MYIYIYPQLSPVLSSRRFLPAAPRSAARGLRCVDQALDAATGRGGPARAAAAGEDGETLAGGAALIGMVGAGSFEAKLGGVKRFAQKLGFYEDFGGQDKFENRQWGFEEPKNGDVTNQRVGMQSREHDS